MTKATRKHANTTRLTARERSVIVCADLYELPEVTFPAHCKPIHKIIERALQAHARQALARERLRQKVRPCGYRSGREVCKLMCGHGGQHFSRWAEGDK